MKSLAVDLARIAEITQDASAAWAGGGRYFTPLIGYSQGARPQHGTVPDWPGAIEGIESVGWHLHTWAVGVIENGCPVALPLFIRP